MTHAKINLISSSIIIETLHRVGIRHICFSPGSRSTPLVLAAFNSNKFKLHSHFDERGLGFLALGIAKNKRSKVAIITTSGTAVSNLLPAVCEANLTGERLILLTADRPEHLIDCGANQAINQKGIFSSHITSFLNIPTPHKDSCFKSILTKLEKTIYEQDIKGGPIHINCPYDEPLYDDKPFNINEALKELGQDGLKEWLLSDTTYTKRYIKKTFYDKNDIPNLKGKNCLVIIGRLEKEDAEYANKFAKILGFPVFCDPQSGQKSTYPFYELWLRNKGFKKELDNFDYIIQFGAELISKNLNNYINESIDSNKKYYFIQEKDSLNNQFHNKQEIFLISPKDFVKTYFRYNKSDEKEDSPILPKSLKDGVDKISNFINKNHGIDQKEGDSLTEVSIASALTHLSKCFCTNIDLFIGNSLIPRLIDMFSYINNTPVFSNRGASGIDGLIATAAGIVLERKKPMCILLGDTSLLYDINSLSLLEKEKIPTVVVVINNNGGGIFNLLPVSESVKRELYTCPHGYDFSAAAVLFKIGYYKESKKESFLLRIKDHLKNGIGSIIIEVETDTEKTVKDIESIVSYINAIHL